MTRLCARAVRIGAPLAPHLTVLGKVGRGAGGRVFIVWNHRTWCPMAAKVFSSAGRADREATILASIEHPHVVRCFGRSRFHRGAYILLEFVEGPTLRDLLHGRPRGRLGTSDAVRLAIHIGGALAHVHARGFLHLDVKPSNIIVATDGRPVLFDFSAARPITSRRLGYAVGTDPYMAPEQCAGDVLTPASDVYGWGLLLYRTLAGRLPFPPCTRGRPFPQTAALPVPLRRYVPSAPRGLEQIVMACLARRPEDRPRSPAEVIPALHDFIGRGPRMWPERLNPQRVALRGQTMSDARGEGG